MTTSPIPPQDNVAPRPVRRNNAERSDKLVEPGKPLLRFWLEAFIVVITVMIGSVAVLVLLDRIQTQASTDRLLNTQVADLAQRLSQPLGLYHAILLGAASDPALGQLLAHGDTDAITAREKSLGKLIPGALRIRLLKPGYNTLDLKSEPPLSYASLTLLKLAESADQPPPIELHEAGESKFYLIGATALHDETGTVQGLFHITLNASILNDEIKHFSTSSGLVALQQQVDGKPVTIFGSLNIYEPSKLFPLADSQLQLAYWYTDTQEWPLLMPGLQVIAGLLLIYGLVFGFQYYSLRKDLILDLAKLLDMLENAVAGRKPKPEVVSIREFASTLGSLASLIKETRFKTTHYMKGAPPSAFPKAELIEEVTQPEQPSVASTSNDIETTPRESLPTVNETKWETASIKPAILTAAGQQLTPSAPASVQIPEAIFRNYDIRGIVGQSITVAIARELGRAIGSLLQEQGQKAINVGWDARPSGVELSTALIDGLVASGCNVVELGILPTPMLYFATRFLDSDAGVMISAGRFPNDYNGFKVLINGELLTGPDLLALRHRALEGPLWEGVGSKRSQDLIPGYIQRITDDVSIARSLKVVIDCGSGCSSLIAPQLFQILGCEVVELFCELDNNYPGHPPDPSRPENLKSLQATVLAERADLGLAFDGDGDRLGVVDSRGRIIWPDRLLMALAADVLARNPGGDVIFDVNCSRALASQILQNGGRPVMWKAGHAPIKAKLRDTQALLAGEWGGHIIFQERWYGFDDACYAGARLLEILSVDPRNSAELFDDCPESLSTPEFSLRLQEGEVESVIEKLQQRGEVLGGARLVTVDGLRAEYEDGWGLVRSSNTMAALRFRFEADNEAALGRIQQAYRELLAAVAPKLKAPF